MTVATEDTEFTEIETNNLPLPNRCLPRPSVFSVISVADYF